MGPCDVSWFPQSPVGVGGKGGHCIMLGYNMFCSTIVVLVRFDSVWFDLVLRMLMSGSDWGITVGGEGRVAGLVGHRGWGEGGRGGSVQCRRLMPEMEEKAKQTGTVPVPVQHSTSNAPL